MASFNNKNSGLQFTTAMANNFNVAGDLPIEDVHNPSSGAVQNDFHADTSATLHPVCPDPDASFQPFSDYWVARLLHLTMLYFKNFCTARQVELDTKYWKRYTRRILETQSPDKALVISSPAGSGKSTWMQSFLLALRDVMKEQPEFDLSLVGVVVVLQKVEDLNELADLLNQDCAEDHPVMVSLQGWTDSGSRRGLCRNPSVDNYEACLRQQCPYAGKCPILHFSEDAKTAPIVGMTQERFCQLREQGLDSVLYQYATPKSNKPRLIVLPDLALQTLLQQKKQQTEMRLMVGAAWENSDDLVFTDELGRHLKHDVVYRNLKRIFQCMGVPDLRFHDLRHSYAVLSLQSGCDIKTVQENLGHYAAAFTLDTYGHVTEQMRRDGAEKINNFIESMEKKMG